MQGPPGGPPIAKQPTSAAPNAPNPAMPAAEVVGPAQHTAATRQETPPHGVPHPPSAAPSSRATAAWQANVQGSPSHPQGMPPAVLQQGQAVNPAMPAAKGVPAVRHPGAAPAGPAPPMARFPHGAPASGQPETTPINAPASSGPAGSYGTMENDGLSPVQNLPCPNEAAFAMKRSDIVKYSGISVSESFLEQLWNDIWYILRHLQRSGESYGLLQNVASPKERKWMQSKVPHIQPVLVNMLVWRRSLLKVLCVAMVVVTCSQMLGAYRGWINARDTVNKPLMTTDYKLWRLEQEDAHEPGKFNDYSFAVMLEVQRLMMSQSIIVQALGTIVNAVLNFVALVMIIKATFVWGEFRLSRKLVVSAWFLSVAAPFFVSMAPARLWVHWSHADPLLYHYQHELEDFLGMDEKIVKLKKTCDTIRDSGADKMEKGIKSFARTCHIISFLPNSTITLPTSVNVFRWQKVDVVPAHNGCRDANRFISDGKPVDVLMKVQKGCAMIEDVLAKTGDFQRVDQVSEYFTSKLKYAAEAAIAVALALRNLGSIFPAALSIAPGLMKGAIRMKLLVPQSNIPGMFMLVLPWLYCPLTWCMYSICFQAVGNWTLLVGMLILAFNPIIYALLGKHFRLDKPLRDDEVVVAIRKLQTTQKVAFVLAYGCIVIFVLCLLRMYAARNNYWGWFKDWDNDSLKHTWGAEIESAWMEDLYQNIHVQRIIIGHSNRVLIFICQLLRGYLLTSAAGMDFMCGQMVGFRRVEKSVNADGKVSLDLRQEYHMRMDQLVDLEKRSAANDTMPPAEPRL